VCRGQQYPDHAYPALSPKQAKNLKDKIKGQYRVRLILDNLPITTYDLELDPESVRPGFEVGYNFGEHYYVNNHLMFKILVHESNGQYSRLSLGEAELEAAAAAEAGGRRMLKVGDQVALGPGEKMYMVVGFEVVACSIKRAPGATFKNVPCPASPDDPGAPEGQEVKGGARIVYTYDTYWDTSDITWATRWDAYLQMPGGRVHWFSILNSIMVVVVMSCIVAMIMVRTIRRDLQRYEALLVDGDAGAKDAEESGWKMVSGDVFRAPPAALSLAVHVGSGVQIMASATVTLLFAALGFLSPASRGSLLTAALALYLLMSAAAGFSAVWLWTAATRSTEGWHRVCWRVACFFPGVTVAALTGLNLFLWGTGSSGAIPLLFFFSVIALWLLISIPLAYAGGAVAARRELRPFPTRTNQIPRHVPPPHWASHPAVLFLAAGLLPFGTIFVELYFAMTSMWQGYFYYIFGFLFLVAALTVVITVEVSIVCTYVQLCAEDYLWWWRSFYRGGSIALYVLLYSGGCPLSPSLALSRPAGARARSLMKQRRRIREPRRRRLPRAKARGSDALAAALPLPRPSRSRLPVQHAAPPHGRAPRGPLPLLHVAPGVVHVPGHGHCRLPGLLHLHRQDLRGRQGRLSGAPSPGPRARRAKLAPTAARGGAMTCAAARGAAAAPFGIAFRKYWI
jgi:transmembrane 9 superfamily protein 2/4